VPKDTHDDFDEDEAKEVEIDQASTDEAKSTYDTIQKKGKEWRATLLPHGQALLKIKRMFHNPVKDTYDDRAFGQHCQKNKIDWKPNERAALIYFAEHPTEADYLLKNSTSTSIRLMGRQLRRQVEGEPEGRDADDIETEAGDDIETEASKSADDVTVANATEGDGAVSEVRYDWCPDDDGDVTEEEYFSLYYDCPDMDPFDALVRLGQAWSTPKEFAEFLQTLTPARRAYLASHDAFAALVDLAEVLKGDADETEAEAEAEADEEVRP
jgi:hypothetical protein